MNQNRPCDPEDRLSSYDYHLPPELIAQIPAENRQGSRLLTVDRRTQALGHLQFSDFPELLRAGDLLVLNDTRVVPARLVGHREATGGRWEGLFLREEGRAIWKLIGQTRGKLQPGEAIVIPAPRGERPLKLSLLERLGGGEWTARCDDPRTTWEILEEFGQIPLPPYIERERQLDEDRERYQTVFATRPGAVAAPTAGLHFTDEILEQCQAAGAGLAYVTLHVGLGTFRPVSVEDLSQHVMHTEWAELPAVTAEAIRRARADGGRIIAVGTTSVRTLETAAQTGELRPWSGETNLFIRPPYQFRIVDAMVTNFHLPKSTLLMLVSAFAGRELIQRAYAEAIANQYRFFSYGDAMFIGS